MQQKGAYRGFKLLHSKLARKQKRLNLLEVFHLGIDPKKKAQVLITLSVTNFKKSPSSLTMMLSSSPGKSSTHLSFNHTHALKPLQRKARQNPNHRVSGRNLSTKMWRRVVRLETKTKTNPILSIFFLSCTAGLGDAIRDLFDFEKWAPRSSRAWRLGQEPVYRNRPDPPPPLITEDDVEVLNQRLTSSRQSMSSVDMQKDDEETPSFLRSTDAEFADALNSRITEVATSPSGSNGSGATGEDEYVGSVGLSGEGLMALIYEKFEKYHDASFVRRDIPGKAIVSLNIYHAHLGQRSFPMTEEELKEKMDGVALYLSAWGQEETVVSFLKAPIAPRRGLPSRPIVGNAVSITLNLTNEQIQEWLGR